MSLIPQIKYFIHTRAINHESVCLSVCGKTIWNKQVSLQKKQSLRNRTSRDISQYIFLPKCQICIPALSLWLKIEYTNYR